MLQTVDGRLESHGSPRCGGLDGTRACAGQTIARPIGAPSASAPSARCPTASRRESSSVSTRRTLRHGAANSAPGSNDPPLDEASFAAYVGRLHEAGHAPATLAGLGERPRPTQRATCLRPRRTSRGLEHPKTAEGPLTEEGVEKCNRTALRVLLNNMNGMGIPKATRRWKRVKSPHVDRASPVRR